MASKRILVTYNNSETLLRCFSPNDDCCPFKNKTIEDGDHCRLFFIIFHTSIWNSFWIIEGWEIIDVLWIININIFIWNDFWIIKDLRIIKSFPSSNIIQHYIFVQFFGKHCKFYHPGLRFQFLHLIFHTSAWAQLVSILGALSRSQSREVSVIILERQPSTSTAPFYLTEIKNNIFINVCFQYMFRYTAKDKRSDLIWNFHFPFSHVDFYRWKKGSFKLSGSFKPVWAGRRSRRH